MELLRGKRQRVEENHDSDKDTQLAVIPGDAPKQLGHINFFEELEHQHAADQVSIIPLFSLPNLILSIVSLQSLTPQCSILLGKKNAATP